MSAARSPYREQAEILTTSGFSATTRGDVLERVAEVIRALRRGLALIFVVRWSHPSRPLSGRCPCRAGWAKCPRDREVLEHAGHVEQENLPLLMGSRSFPEGALGEQPEAPFNASFSCVQTPLRRRGKIFRTVRRCRRIQQYPTIYAETRRPPFASLWRSFPR
jgi:hypothetical protein